MQIDMYTALFGYILSNAIAILCAIFVFGKSSERRVTGSFVAMYVFLVLGALLALLRGRIPEVPSIIAGNLLVLISVVFLFIVISRILRKKYNYTVLIISLVAGTALMIYFTAFNANLPMRLAVFSAVHLFNYFLLLLFILRKDDKEQRGTALMTATVITLILINASRIYVALVHSNEVQELMELQYDPILIILGGIVSLVFVPALLSLVNGINLSKIEESNRESEFFAGIYNSSPIPVIVMDGNDVIRHANQALCDLTMHDYESLAGMNWLEVFLPETLKKHVKDSIHSSEKRTNAYHKTRILKYDGVSVHVEMLIEKRFDEFNYLDYYIVFLHDLTALQKAQDEAEKAELQKQSILLNIPGFTYRCLFDRNWTMLELSSGFTELTGYDTEDFIGNKKMTFNDIIQEEFRNEVWEDWNHSLNEKTPYVGEYKIRLASGESCWVWEHGRLTDDHYGETKVIEGFITDITKTKELEEENRRMETYIRDQKKMEAIGTVAAGVAHEINNPVNGILNYAELISDLESDNKEVADYAREIIHETERVSRIVKGLLQFSGHQDLGPQIIDIEEPLMQTIELFEASCRNDEIIVKTEIDDNLPTIVCDCSKIQQVLMSILTNARDALNLRYSQANENKIIDISARFLKDNEGKWVRITIGDHGLGIADEIQPYIFEPFFTTKDRSGNSGLGLAVSYGNVMTHKGRLTFETMENKGTEFYLDMPVGDFDGINDDIKGN